MLKSLKELSDLALGLFFDCFELIGLLKVPTPALQTTEVEHARTLQLSALIFIVIFSLWAASTRAGSFTFDVLSIAAASIVYFSFCAWVVYLILLKSDLIDPGANVRSNALTLTLGFNLVVIFFVAVIRQSATYTNALLSIEVTPRVLHTITFVVPVAIAGAILYINSARNVGPGGRVVSQPLVAAFTLANIALADIYVYLILFQFTRQL